MTSQATKQDPACIFCKIAAGQIPAHKVYEDDQVLAFLDVGPLSRGHVLIIPRSHYETLDQMPAETAAACLRVAPRLSRAVLQATGAKAFNLLQNNGRLAHQEVNHVHFHIIPKTEHGGLGITWPAGKLDPDDAQTLRQQIAQAMQADA